MHMKLRYCTFQNIINTKLLYFNNLFKKHAMQKSNNLVYTFMIISM